MWFMYIHQLDPFYLSSGSKNSLGVIWGHRGQKVIFTKNATSPTYYMVMVMGLMHRSNQLAPFYQSYGYKNWTGVKWGHRGQTVICTKHAITHPWYITWLKVSYMLINLRPSTSVTWSDVNLGSFGVTGVKKSFSLNMLELVHVTSEWS